MMNHKNMSSVIKSNERFMTGNTVTVTVEPSELENRIGERVCIHGSIYKIRKMKGFSFVLLRTKREVVQCIASENV